MQKGLSLLQACASVSQAIMDAYPNIGLNQDRFPKRNPTIILSQN